MVLHDFFSMICRTSSHSSFDFNFCFQPPGTFTTGRKKTELTLQLRTYCVLNSSLPLLDGAQPDYKLNSVYVQ